MIALIITIIVLLILAGVSISMVVGDNGILTQAVNASVVTDVTDTKEQIQIALVGYLDSNGDYSKNNVASAVQDVLGSDASITENEDGTYTVTTEKGNTVDITDIINGEKPSWWYTDDTYTAVTNGTDILSIGDIVYYNAVTDATILSYTSETIASGYDSDQTFTLEDEDTDYIWKIIGADEDTGELLIVLSCCSSTGYNYIKTNTNVYYYLKGQDGYVNCVTELDNICSLFGQGYGATGARIITIKDVNKLTGYDPDEAQYNNGTTYVYQYGNEVMYELNSDDGYIYYKGTKYPTTLTSSEYITGIFFDNKTWISLNSGEYITLMSDTYTYYEEDYSINNSVVFPSSGRYWLGSSTLSCSSGFVAFGCRYVYRDYVSSHALFRSFGEEEAYYGGIRPVVSLESDITLIQDSDGEWSIK